MPTNKQFVVSISLILIVVLATLGAAFANVSLGVKQGNWIEYQVSLSGTPPADHAVNWSRIEIVTVEGNAATLNVTSQLINGTYQYQNVPLNLDLGQLGDEFLIPANLNVGDSFYDATNGNVTITGTEQRTVAGVERTLITASTQYTTFWWDKQTGIVVEANSSYPSANFGIDTIADKTNMWQSSIGFDSSYYIAIFVVLFIIIAAIFLLIRRQMKRTK
jgi:hypothetical protein